MPLLPLRDQFSRHLNVCPHLSKMYFTSKKPPFTDEQWFYSNGESTFTANLINH